MVSVRNICPLILVVMLSATTVEAENECVLSSARVMKDIQTRVTVGQPVVFLLEAEGRCSLQAGAPPEASEIATRLGLLLLASVAKDGIQCPRRLGESLSHDLIVLEAMATTVLPRNKENHDGPDASVHATYLATSFVDLRTLQFVFREPGIHTLALNEGGSPGLNLTVTVDAPSKAEEALVSRLEGTPVMTLLANIEECPRPGTVDDGQLERLLTMSKGSRLENELSTVVGQAKACTLQRQRANEVQARLQADPSANIERVDYDKSLSNLAHFFEHSIQEDPKSEIDMVDLSRFGSIEMRRSTLNGSADESSRARTRVAEAVRRMQAYPGLGKRMQHQLDPLVTFIESK